MGSEKPCSIQRVIDFASTIVSLCYSNRGRRRQERSRKIWVEGAGKEIEQKSLGDEDCNDGRQWLLGTGIRQKILYIYLCIIIKNHSGKYLEDTPMEVILILLALALQLIFHFFIIIS